MEDALISPAGFMILSGAGLVEATKSATLKVHQTEQTDAVKVTANDAVYGSETYAVSEVKIGLKEKPFTNAGENFIYVMFLDNGEVVTEPYIPAGEFEEVEDEDGVTRYYISLNPSDDLNMFYNGCVVLVDYYTEKESGAQQIEITPDKFGGNYYLEASTLFRDTNGVDMPAEFIIPNCKIQSNFTFTMASSGDPSTFTFTMDAFPDYTRFDKTKKVLAAIQIIDVAGSSDLARERTASKQHAKFEG
jgi:hypothetical protein